MIGGVDPILMFYFPVLPKSAAYNAISGVPLIGPYIAENVGVPIPIYLSRERTGIIVTRESGNIDIQENITPRYDGGKPIVQQAALGNTINIELLGDKTSPLLSVLLAMCDLAFSKLANQEYRVTYINGPVQIIGGLMKDFAYELDNDSERLPIKLQLSKSNALGSDAVTTASVISRVVAALPG